MKEYIAYSGTAFTVEWYFDSIGNSDVLEYFNNKIISTFDRVMANPKQKELFDKEYSEFLLSERLLETKEKQTVKNSVNIKLSKKDLQAYKSMGVNYIKIMADVLSNALKQPSFLREASSEYRSSPQG